jgi:S1-C subfamily serine protease
LFQAATPDDAEVALLVARMLHGNRELIAGVFRGTPASTVGLRAGDVIVAAGGHRVGSPLGLQSVLGRHHPGDRVSISWVARTGVHHSATITLKAGPAG